MSGIGSQPFLAFFLDELVFLLRVQLVERRVFHDPLHVKKSGQALGGHRGRAGFCHDLFAILFRLGGGLTFLIDLDEPAGCQITHGAAGLGNLDEGFFGLVHDLGPFAVLHVAGSVEVGVGLVDEVAGAIQAGLQKILSEKLPDISFLVRIGIFIGDRQLRHDFDGGFQFLARLEELLLRLLGKGPVFLLERPGEQRLPLISGQAGNLQPALGAFRTRRVFLNIFFQLGPGGVEQRRSLCRDFSRARRQA